MINHDTVWLLMMYGDFDIPYVKSIHATKEGANQAQWKVGIDESTIRKMRVKE